MGIRNAGDSFGYMLKRSRKSRALAVLFSLIICGLGQVYTGRIWKGLFMFLLAWVIVLSGIWPIAFLIAIYSAFDAYFCAVSVNRALDEFSQNSQTLTG